MYTQIDQAELYEPLIDQEKYDARNDGTAVWYHSFWVRRFKEGNAEVVYSILQDLVTLDVDVASTGDPEYLDDVEARDHADS